MSMNVVLPTEYGAFTFQFFLNDEGRICFSANGENLTVNRVEYSSIRATFKDNGISLQNIHLYTTRADGQWKKEMSWNSRESVIETLRKTGLDIIKSRGQVILQSLNDETFALRKALLESKVERLAKELAEAKEELATLNV